MTSPNKLAHPHSLVWLFTNLSSGPPAWLLSLTAFTMLSMKGTLQGTAPTVVFSVVSLQYAKHALCLERCAAMLS